jgi:hypothetical protein
MILETSILQTLPVVVFRNDALNNVSAIVCTSDAAQKAEAERIARLPHCTVLAIEHAAVKSTGGQPKPLIGNAHELDMGCWV